ncbi:MAG: response regulator [Verrucomicrobia bacterium]|nr:response regulator [Verrucomicrobiota bacterium]
MQALEANHRILIVDDNPAIHEDFRKILCADQSGTNDLDEAEAVLFGEATQGPAKPTFEMSSTYQGEEAIQKAGQAREANRPYAVAFVDMRMPPGLDGLATIKRLWEVDPALEIVICTAYSDHPWEKIRAEVGSTAQLLVLKKPFDNIEVLQFATALTEKWNLARHARLRMDTLEQLVAERTKQLVNAHRTKTEFLANVSHELLTPMNGIIGLASVLETANLNQEDRECLEDLKKSGATLLAMLKKVLAFNQIEAGRLKLESKLFDVREVIQSVLTLHAQKAKEKGLALTCRIEPEVPPELRGDPGCLRQVLSDLTENAVKFTERGGATLQAALESGTNEKARVRFAVTDTGIGIPAALLEELNLSFAQIDGSTTRKRGGVGLGLTLARQLIPMMDGTLSCTSEPGKGTTFAFSAVFRKPDAANGAGQERGNDALVAGQKS